MFRKIILTVLMAVILSPSLPLCAGETWKVASLEWPPFTGANLPDGGSGIKVLREALKSQGIGLDVKFLPWSRAIHDARKPEWAGFYPAWPEEVKTEYFTASSSLFKSPIAIAQHVDAPLKMSSLMDLKGKRIGLVQNYGNTKEFNDLVDSKVILGESSLTDLQALKKLEAKHLDGMIIDINVMKYLLKNDLKSADGKIVANSGWMVNKDLLFSANNANPQKAKILETIEKGLKAIKPQKIVDDANAAIFK